MIKHIQQHQLSRNITIVKAILVNMVLIDFVEINSILTQIYAFHILFSYYVHMTRTRGMEPLVNLIRT